MSGRLPVVRLPFASDDCASILDEALRTLTLCSDAALACGSVTARVYCAGAAGSLRHALAALANEGRLRSADLSTFEVSRLGGGELFGIGGRWDTLRDCVLPGGERGAVRALWPEGRVEDCIWLRGDDAFPGLAVRGRVLLNEGGEPVFKDEPQADRWAAPAVLHDLGRDLVREDLCDISRTPALGVALELALASGSWLHASSGTRWFVDRAGARAIVRMLGSPVAASEDAARRLGGFVDREALLMIESLGWRHLPTPRAC